MTPLCSLCGRRPVSLVMNPWRNRASRKAQRGHRVTLKSHDLCAPCWRTILAPILNQAHTARLKGEQGA